MLNPRITENTSLRLLLASAALAGIFAGARLLRRGHGQLGEARVEPIDLERVPQQLGVWTGVQGPLSGPVVEKPFDSVAHLARVYRGPSGQTVNLELDAFAPWDDASAMWDNTRPHPPEICYPQLGCIEQGSKEVPLGEEASGETARLLTFRHGTQQLSVLYWYQLAGQLIVERFGLTPANREVWKQPVRPPVLKIMLVTMCNREDVAEQRLRSIAGALRASLKHPL
jgi:hypothetical protein